MSKKTNSLSLRSLKNKSWASKSFFEDFNYSKILYQDLYITDYIKNILQYQFFNGIVQDVIIQRKRDIIYINVSYYSLAKRKKNSDVSFTIAFGGLLGNFICFGIFLSKLFLPSKPLESI